jgi:hypothetical protein
MTISKVSRYVDLKVKTQGGASAAEQRKATTELQYVQKWCEAESISADFLERHAAANGSNEAQGAQTMQISLYAYAKVMRKRMCDIVPQMVHTALVADVAERLQPHLLAAMSSERLHASAVDSASVAKRRAAAELRVKNFTDALEHLSTI